MASILFKLVNNNGWIHIFPFIASAEQGPTLSRGASRFVPLLLFQVAPEHRTKAQVYNPDSLAELARITNQITKRKVLLQPFWPNLKHPGHIRTAF